jgi:vancomycin permeability regulator SanA
VGIVLGFCLTREGHVSPILQDRLRKGAELLKQGRVHHLILSGGLQNHTRQAEAMAQWLQQEEGIDSQVLILESQSNNTWQNALQSMQIVVDHGWRSVVVITSSFHQLRSALVFDEVARRYCSNTSAIPTEVEWKNRPQDRCIRVAVAEPLMDEHVEPWKGQWDCIREAVAIPYYVLRGRIALGSALWGLAPVAMPYLCVSVILCFIYYTFHRFILTR